MPEEKTPILKAPFYAAKIVSCAYGTNGGVGTASADTSIVYMSRQ